MGRINPEQILDTVLELVEETGSLQNVNFREIARRLGCNHTNLYNYYPDFDSLRLAALAHLVHKTRKLMPTIQPSSNPETQISQFVNWLARFALQKPGWYRFVWLEQISGNDLSHAMNNIPRPEALLLPLLNAYYQQKLSMEQLERIAAFAHSFLHGELCKWLAQRHALKSEKALTSRLSNEILLYLSLHGEREAPAMLVKKSMSKTTCAM